MGEKILELVRSNFAKLAKFESCEKAYEIRKLANFANFSLTIRRDFDDLSHSATVALKSEAELRRGRYQAGAW